MAVSYSGAHAVAFLKVSGSNVTIRKSWGVGTGNSFFLIPAAKLHVKPPEPNYAIVSVPGSSKHIDLSQNISGALTYGRRSGSWDFYVVHELWNDWEENLSDLMSYLNGTRMVCLLKDEPNHPYSGRVFVSDWKNDQSYSQVTINYDFDYEYDGSIDFSGYDVWPPIEVSGIATIVYPQIKTVTSKATYQTVIPDEGYNYMTRVNINGVDYQETVNEGNGRTAWIACDDHSGSTPPSGDDPIDPGTETARVQDKTVVPTSSTQIVEPDEGYNYLTSVTVQAVPTQEFTVDPASVSREIVPSSGHFLSKVTINPVLAQTKVVYFSGSEPVAVSPDFEYNFLSGVMIMPQGTEEDTWIEPINDGKTRIYVSIPNLLTGDSVEFLLPVRTLENKTIFVDWNDGSEEETFSNMPNQPITHTYATNTDYIITVRGESSGVLYAVDFSRWIYAMDIGGAITEFNPNTVANRLYNLRELILEPSVTYVPYSALYWAFSLKRVLFLASCSTISEHVFYYCRTLRSVELGSSITGIERAAFKYCSMLKSISIPEGVTSIGPNVFEGCSSLTSAILPSSVTTIGDFAFYECIRLGNVLLPDGLISIGDSAFRECNSFTEISVPDSVTTIGSNAFSGCVLLHNISLSSSLTDLPDNLFYYCLTLSSITIPNSVTSIGEATFMYCPALGTISIPESVLSIGASAFRGITRLYVVLNSSSPPSIASNSFDPTAIFLIPSSAIEAYNEATNWSALSDSFVPY